MREFDRQNIINVLVSVLGTGCFALLPAVSALAQDLRVDVTGSNIKRIEGEGALPVLTITRAEIEREGIQSAMGIVERLSQNSSIGGLNMAGGAGATGVGMATASLRGLGASRTLVLLNGRRLANTAFSGVAGGGAAVDINSIPLSAIDRVEVLTDGASAIYGSDAIAGVINFILRSDYSGAEASAYYGDSQHGGGQQQRYTATAGWGDLQKDKFNVFATVDYQKLEGIKASQRPFSASAYQPNAAGGPFDKTSGNSFPGNVFLPAVPGREGTTQNPNYPACRPPYSFGTSTAETLGQCRFDYASIIDISPPSEQWNAFGKGTWQINNDLRAFIEASYSQTTSTLRVSPSPISASTLISGEPILTNPGTPFYPTALATQYGLNGQPLAVSWRALELGARTDQNEITQTRVVAGVQGVAAGWDYSAAVNWSDSKATNSWLGGWVSGTTLQPILNSGQINLFGFNTPEAVSLMSQSLILGPVLTAKASSTEFDLTGSKDLYQLPAGPLALALGGLYRQEKYQTDALPILNSGDVPGIGSVSSVPAVDRNIWAVYAEANIPIVKNLEANVAVRYDDYEGVGNTTNPKLSVRWQPLKELLFRGSIGTGFRAPSLAELYAPTSVGSTGDLYSDPLRCPKTGSPRDCDAQFNTQQGGNTSLKPEKSTQWLVGLVVAPLPQMTFGVDYWNVEVKNVVGTKGEASIFGDMVAAEAQGLLFRYAPGSTGCPASEQAGGLPCPVSYGVQTNINLNTLQTSGLDFSLAYRSPTQPWGTFSASFNGTYVYEWNQTEQGGDKQRLIGTYAGGVAATVFGSGSTGSFPRWKHNLLLGYTYGPWQANLTQLYIDGYTEPSDDTPTRRVGAYSVWGLNAAYTGLRNFTLTLGVKNIFDANPPYTRQGQAFQIGYDPALTDPTGRFFWGSIKYAFK